MIDCSFLVIWSGISGVLVNEFPVQARIAAFTALVSQNWATSPCPSVANWILLGPVVQSEHYMVPCDHISFGGQEEARASHGITFLHHRAVLKEAVVLPARRGGVRLLLANKIGLALMVRCDPRWSGVSPSMSSQVDC